VSRIFVFAARITESDDKLDRKIWHGKR
jgi:hypothetical protein